ncbi:MAG: hypothetical protein QOJ00_784 [Actinomycetota bacterium]
MPEPTDSLNEVLGAMADRIGKYADIWQEAARRNAAGDYTATDAVNDMQQAFALGLRDAADVGTAALAAFATVTRPTDDSTYEKPAPAKRAAPKKRAAAATKRAAAPTRRPAAPKAAKRTRPSK